MTKNLDSLRTIRQREFAERFLTLKKNGILHLCPRFGKCRVGVYIFQAVEEPKVLIAYPDNKIKQSWLEEFDKMEYKNPDVAFSTHRSLHKYVDQEFDLVVIDEIHLLSKNQLNELKKIRRKGIRILGLSGSIAKKTAKELKQAIGIDIIAEYPVATAIEEGVITDYEIRVIQTPLTDDEQNKLNRYTRLINKNMELIPEEREDDSVFRFERMRIIQRSEAKRLLTVRMLNKFCNERVLVFCGLTEVADNLGIPSYHAKVKNKTLFTDFAAGKGKHMAVVKIGNTGVTYKPLSKVLVNYSDSNPENMAQKIMRCMAMEYENEEKKAIIYIISSDSEVEQQWLSKALEFFDLNKIIYI